VITQADVQRLQDNVYLAERDVNQLRTRDSARATQLQSELDELGDEVIYLRVKLRKERTLARSEPGESRIEGGAPRPQRRQRRPRRRAGPGSGAAAGPGS
jgi:hypothetical protein